MTERHYRQGRTLDTAQTRKWSAEARVLNDRYEQKMVVYDFHEADEGRSRKLLCQCQTAEEAAAVVEAIAKARAQVITELREWAKADDERGRKNAQLLHWDCSAAEQEDAQERGDEWLAVSLHRLLAKLDEMGEKP